MKFSKFREFRLVTATIESVVKYLSVDLVFSLRELYTGLSRLDFTENFQSFKVVVELPLGGGDVAIRNQLSPIVPTGKIILRDGGGNTIVDGNTDWNEDYVYLKNTSGTTDYEVTVVFFK